MTITIIAAVSKNGVIGKDGKIPWKIPEDIKRFKELTIGHPVIIGRKTYWSLPDKFRPLPNRTNIVASRNEKGHLKYPLEVIVCNSIEDAVKKASIHNPDIYVIGGEKIYREFIRCADKIELTRVNRNVEGDAYFPEICPENWEITAREDHVEYSFITYEKK
ncbi:MAG TPA: dihydrofolate reductase [Candidatus Nanoarchaeia archaeon]|nr:dihydrofolate reductase [Candidatus Nanoarchaeia archaeon]